MKKMRIEKNLMFPEPVEKVMELKVSEGFTYQRNEEGIRAIGPLYIRGIYEHGGQQHKFQEILEMDVLAPQEKLGTESFYLEVGEFEGIPSKDGMHVEVLLHIHGLAQDNRVEPQKEVVNVEVPTEPIIQKEERASFVEAEPETTDKETFEVQDNENNEQDKEIDSIEDLFDDSENVYTSYRMVVAKPNDSYESIAKRYDVDENDLRSTNKDKEVCAKTLVILPYKSAQA